MPTRSKPNARARALMSAASVLLVDAEDFIGLLFHAHRGGVDAIRDGLIKRLTLVQQSLEPRKPISVGSQQGAMGRVFHALVGDVAVANVQLVLGETVETVEVNSTVQLVQSQSATLGTVVDSRTMTEVPLSTRNYTQILTMSPGVVAGCRNSPELAGNPTRTFGLYQRLDLSTCRPTSRAKFVSRCFFNIAAKLSPHLPYKRQCFGCASLRLK